jgi:hypothetical protein
MDELMAGMVQFSTSLAREPERPRREDGCYSVAAANSRWQLKHVERVRAATTAS